MTALLALTAGYAVVFAGLILGNARDRDRSRAARRRRLLIDAYTRP